LAKATVAKDGSGNWPTYKVLEIIKGKLKKDFQK
jgi:hypothetical protein